MKQEEKKNRQFVDIEEGNEIENHDQKIDQRMRIFANFFIDRFLEDKRKMGLNFVNRPYSLINITHRYGY